MVLLTMRSTKKSTATAACKVVSNTGSFHDTAIEIVFAKDSNKFDKAPPRIQRKAQLKLKSVHGDNSKRNLNVDGKPLL